MRDSILGFRSDKSKRLMNRLNSDLRLPESEFRIRLANPALGLKVGTWSAVRHAVFAAPRGLAGGELQTDLTS